MIETSTLLELINGQLFGVWFLMGAALVFWMQAGFAMVEAGFTRAKNTGNILMKNLMDFCIGCAVFILLGFGLLLGEDTRRYNTGMESKGADLVYEAGAFWLFRWAARRALCLQAAESKRNGACGFFCKRGGKGNCARFSVCTSY